MYFYIIYSKALLMHLWKHEFRFMFNFFVKKEDLQKYMQVFNFLYFK